MKREQPATEGALLGDSQAELLRDRSARATRRYLDLLRDALLDEHYVENELRIDRLLEFVGTGREIDLDQLANPARRMADAMRQLRRQRRAGELPRDETSTAGMPETLAYAGLGRTRLEHLEACLEAVHED